MESNGCPVKQEQERVEVMRRRTAAMIEYVRMMQLFGTWLSEPNRSGKEIMYLATGIEVHRYGNIQDREGPGYNISFNEESFNNHLRLKKAKLLSRTDIGNEKYWSTSSRD